MESGNRGMGDFNIEAGRYFLLLAVFFLLSCVIGFYHASSNPELAKEKIEAFFTSFEPIKEKPPVFIFLIIFLNNSIKALVATVAGFFFGLFPLSFVFINGYLVGLVVYVKGIEIGFDKVLLLLIPHGIIEIPAILLASSYGLWLGRQFYMKLFRDEKIPMGYLFLKAVKKCLKIVFPMLLIAALIETFVTPLVAFYFGI
jgi:stage II sporulation protein M